MKEYILYGLPEDEHRDFMEVIICVMKSERNIQIALENAPNYGWHSLRVAVFDPRKP